MTKRKYVNCERKEKYDESTNFNKGGWKTLKLRILPLRTLASYSYAKTDNFTPEISTLEDILCLTVCHGDSDIVWGMVEAQ